MWKIAILLLIGTCSTQLFTELPSIQTCAFITSFLICLTLQKNNKITFYLLIFSIGLTFSSIHAKTQLNNKKKLPLNETIQVVGKITDIVQYNDNNASMTFFVSEIITDKGITKKSNLVKLSWYKAPKNLTPGDVWQLELKTKPIRSFYNPGNFDIEKWYFVQKLDANASVTKSKKKLLYNDANFIDSLRFKISKFIENSNLEFKNILTAITIGHKSFSYSENNLFQKTGLSHLMAISGLHVGLFAAIAFFITNMIWRLMPIDIITRVPSFKASAVLGLFATFSYSLLSGFSVSTQRAFIMISCFLILNNLLKRHISNWNKYWLSMIIILIVNPISILSCGFWLSFITVGLILFYYQKSTIKLSFLIFFGMIPISLFVFQNVSIVSPFANLIAIPWFSILTIPFAILGAIFLPLNESIALLLFNVSDFSLKLIWPVLNWFAHFEFSSVHYSINNIWVLFSVSLGTLILLLPKKFPGKFIGVFFLLAIFYNPEKIEYGDSKISVLDVGQGLAVLIKTQNHNMLYDTGPKFGKTNAGDLVVVPFLKYNHIRKLDTMVISHPDADHIGGADSVFENNKIDKIFISDKNSFKPNLSSDCRAGESWMWDGVKFEILHPTNINVKKRNEHSCVIKVSSTKSSILLTGDIGSPSEKKLINKNIESDVLLIPHHGSTSSSSLKFIQKVKPKYALVSAGFNNRYGHPRKKVIDRYHDNGITVLNTIDCGAIEFKMNSLKPKCFKKENQKYWSLNQTSILQN